MASKKITESEVKKMQPGDELRDTETKGFIIRYRKTGKLFYFSYMSPATGTRRNVSVGRLGDITVSQAREAARLMAADVAQRIDPIDKKQAVRLKVEREKVSTLGAFLSTGFKDVTPTKTASKAIASMEKHFPDLLDKQLSGITGWRFEQFKRNYPGSPSGANRILATVRGVFTKAVKAGLLDKSPMPEVKRAKEDRSKKIRYLSEEEELALRDALSTREERQKTERLRFMEHCKTRARAAPEPYTGPYTDHITPMVLLTLNTGLRRGEVFNLKVSDIDLQKRILTVVGEPDETTTGSKSGQTRLIPLNDEAFSVLVAWLDQTNNGGLVFPSPVTGGRFDNINKAWRQLREEAGLPAVRFHDLRHTFGTRLAHARVDLVSIKEMMGHESLETTARYLHTSMERKFEAVALLRAVNE